MEQGFESTVEITLREGETPQTHLIFEKHERIVPDKYYGPYICFYWKKYVFTNHKDVYAVRFTNHNYDLDELKPYCPCKSCCFLRKPKSCSIEWIHGFIVTLVACRCCLGCLHADMFGANYDYIEIAYKKKNE